MRLLHVVPTYIPAWRYGGPIYSVHGLCKALVRRGHSVSVVTTNVDGKGNSDVPLGTPVSIDGVSVHYFPSSLLRRLYYSPPMYRHLQGSIAQFDLVHTHSVFLWPTWAAARLARAHHVPYVVSPRGMLVRDLIARKGRLHKTAWIRLIEKKQLLRAAGVHVTSPVEADDLAALNIRPRNVFEIPNGIDAGSMAQGAISSKDGEMLGELPSDFVLYLGRINWKKGIERLISSLAFAPGATLVVAGNDEEGIRPGLERQAEEGGVGRRVKYVGPAYGPVKEWLLSHAAIVVLPSRSENFGNVILEAMASGTPVVVTPEVGIAPLVAASQCGSVVDGNPAALGAEIGRLLESPSERKAMGDNGVKASRAYSWDFVAERMESAYLQAIS